MTEPEILVVGAGPSGLVAATTLAKAGFAVDVIEQRATIGGAVYRQPAAAIAADGHVPFANAKWIRIRDDFLASGVAVSHGKVLVGIDGDGLVLVEDRNGGRIERLRRRGVLIAVGAVEKVYPRPGWHLPGVSAAGGLQVMMKETGRAPAGRVMLAGNGPLLVAVAAQMARLGNPPVAIVEAGDPLAHVADGIALARHPAVLAEALSYLAQVYRHGIPWLRGAGIRSIARDGGHLAVEVKHGAGVKHWAVDRIGLHDGIRSNDFGLPREVARAQDGPVILRAGDCREALGAMAAQADGRRVALMMSHILSGNTRPPDGDARIGRMRNIQVALGKLFTPVGAASPLATGSDETILCRCEGKTIGDLRQLCRSDATISGREVKLNGRFAMGSCQGRFCAENTASLMSLMGNGSRDPEPKAEDLTGRRWPLRPVSIAALVAAPNTTKTTREDEVHRDDPSQTPFARD